MVFFKWAFELHLKTSLLTDNLNTLGETEHEAAAVISFFSLLLTQSLWQSHWPDCFFPPLALSASDFSFRDNLIFFLKQWLFKELAEI